MDSSSNITIPHIDLNVSRVSNIPNIDKDAFVGTLMHQVEEQLNIKQIFEVPRQLLEQVTEIVKKNYLPIISGMLSTVGVAALLPSMAVVIVNAIGFTSSGVLAGSIAAAVQSSVYGGLTTGVFSLLQAFGATAAVASPAVVVLGSLALAGGMLSLGWWIYKLHKEKRREAGSSDKEGNIDVDYDDDDENYIESSRRLIGP